jgi:Xaa-Pro aminopeptidase
MDKAKFSREVEAYLTQLAEPHQPVDFEPAIAELAEKGAPRARG